MTGAPLDTGPADLRVGNDVVDLGHPRCSSRPEPDPLAARILTSAEASWMDRAPAGPARLRRMWSLWAGKETAYKVASKLRGASPVFRHRAFEAELTDRPEGDGVVRLDGLVRWEELVVHVEGVATDHFVHLVGWGPARAGLPHPVLEMGVEGQRSDATPGFAPSAETEGPPASPEEAAGARTPLARRARDVARTRLAGHLRRRASTVGDELAPRVEILTSRERPGRTPPRVVVDGTDRPDLDLSLTHHGSYVGWVLLLPADGEPGGQRLGR